MMRRKKALLLVGSPKSSGSTSEALGGYLLNRLIEMGFSGTKSILRRAVRDRKRIDCMLASVNNAEVIILACPTYVDSLPAPVIRALEEIVAFRRTHEGHGQPRFLAVANCGFPESLHNMVSLACCRRFAGEAGMIWAGGLSLGGGEALNGASLQNRKGLARNVIRALDLTATALERNESVPEGAEKLMARPLVPRWLYLWIGTRGWKAQARRFGTAGRLGERPWRDRSGETT